MKKIFLLMSLSIVFGTVSVSNCFSQTWNLAGNAATTPATQYVGTSDATDLVLKTNATERMRFYSTGMISIGSNTYSNTKLSLWDNGIPANNFGLGMQLNQFRFHLGGNAADRFSFFNNPTGSELFTIKYNGFVGVGTATPSANLEVFNTSTANFKVSSSITSFELGIPSCSGCYASYAGTSSVVFRVLTSTVVPNKNMIFSTATNANGGGSIIFGSDAAAIMTIKDNNTVGIGTSCIPSDGKLAVNGKIYATAFQIKLTDGSGCFFPDYVFAPSYKLMPLRDVELFIQKNSHLPEVPSASEVDSIGIDVVKMEIVLLKKIEELTLYMIQLQKQNELLIQENAAIKAKVDAIVLTNGLK